MDRRALLIALFALCGCSPNESPKAGANASGVSPPAAAPSGEKQASAALESKSKVPRVAMLVFGTQSTASATAVGAASVSSLFRDRLTGLGYIEGKTILIEES